MTRLTRNGHSSQLGLPMRASFGKYRLQFIPDGLAPKAKLTSRFLG
jgi:hypothetical protein